MDKLGICNLACAEIAAGSIASLDESSVSAAECNRQFDPCLTELLEWSDWWFAKTRATLAEIANDRLDEWTYAYALPTDCATPLMLREYDATATQRQYALAGPYNFPSQAGIPLRFLVDGHVLYANVGPAVLEYSRNNVLPGDLPALVARALALEIASRIAYPIKKDMKLTDTMVRKAEVAKSRAIADNENQSPRIETDYVTEAEFARMGYGDLPPIPYSDWG